MRSECVYSNHARGVNRTADLLPGACTGYSTCSSPEHPNYHTAVKKGMQEDADLCGPSYISTISASPRLWISRLVARHPWLGLGNIPAGFYDLVRPTPAVDKPVARMDTLVVADSCVRGEPSALPY